MAKIRIIYSGIPGAEEKTFVGEGEGDAAVVDALGQAQAAPRRRRPRRRRAGSNPVPSAHHRRHNTMASKQRASVRPPKPPGRGIVKALGQKGTTGNFARIAASKGKGAAVAALQNKLAKRRGTTIPYPPGR